jgi:hypothetical protein
MIQIIAFLSILIFICYKNKYYIEGISQTCSGNLDKELIDFNCSDRGVPKGIKRCYSQTKTEYSCDDSDEICNNEGECVPTLEGGYCKIDSATVKIFNGSTFKDIEDEKMGDEINNSTRAKRKYKKLYSQECNPFVSKKEDDDDNGDNDETEDGSDNSYLSEDEFKDIDSIENEGQSRSHLMSYILYAFIFVFSGFLLYYRKYIYNFYNIAINLLKQQIRN